MSQPYYLIVACLLAFFWYYACAIKSLHIFGKDLSVNFRTILLGILTIIICLYFSWKLIAFTTIGMVIFFIIHATYHELPPTTTNI